MIEKPSEVNIIQILNIVVPNKIGGVVSLLLGLGNDSKVYQQDTEGRWMLPLPEKKGKIAT